MAINVDLLGCLPSCTPQTLPLIPACLDELKAWRGRILDLYFIPCDYEINESKLLDVSTGGWWADLTATPNPPLRRFGMGVGTYAQSEALKIDGGGCVGEQIIEMEWEMTYTITKMDLSEDFLTHEFVNSLANGALNNYNVIGRFCKPEDTILLMGRTKLEAVGNTHPGGLKEFQNFELKFRWTPNNNTVPQPFKVPGLSAILLA